MSPNVQPTCELLATVERVGRSRKARTTALTTLVLAGFLNDAFDATSLPIGYWSICTGLASVVLWAAEVKKLLGRRLSSRQAAVCDSVR